MHPYISKFREEQLQSHIWGRASQYMRKWGNISPYVRRPLVIYDFATAPFWISLYMGKFWFSFLSVWYGFATFLTFLVTLLSVTVASSMGKGEERVVWMFYPAAAVFLSFFLFSLDALLFHIRSVQFSHACKSRPSNGVIDITCVDAAVRERKRVGRLLLFSGEMSLGFSNSCLCFTRFFRG